MGRAAKVLLIGTTTYWMPKESYELLGMDIWPANFGYSTRSRSSDGVVPLPDPIEFDLIVSDFHNTYNNSDYERKLTEGDAYVARPVLNTHWYDRALELANSLRPQFGAALRNGATMIVVSGPLGTDGGQTNYDWVPFPATTEMTKNPFSGPAECLWDDSREVCGPLYEEFGDDFAWTFGLTINVPEARSKAQKFRPFWLPRNSAKTPERNEFEVWATNKAGHAVAGRFAIGDGQLIFVPNIRDPQRRSELIRHLVTSFYPALHPELVPGYWVSSYWPPSLAKRLQQLQDETETLRKQMETKGQGLVSLQEKIQVFRPMTHTKSNSLKALVARALDEVFGCKVTDMDSTTAYGTPKVFDLLVECNRGRLAVEVRGKENRTLTGDDIDKLLRNVEKYGGGSSVQPVFILNPAFEFPVGSPRRALSKQQTEYAASKGVCVLATPTMLEAIARVLVGELAPERFQELLFQPGELGEGTLQSWSHN